MLARPDPAFDRGEALASCLRDLPTTRVGAAYRADLGQGRVLLFAASAAERDAAAAQCTNGHRVMSRSRTSDCHAAVLARHGRIGLDIETVSRIALNATAGDAWLADSERPIVIAAADPLIELACRWVLREAYGKALGVGLALPLDQLHFRGRAGRIVLDAPGTPRGWDFALYRRADMLCAIAGQATPLAPLGRKPPGPVVDR